MIADQTRPADKKLWWDFRYIWMFISTIWVFSLIGGVLNFWQSYWEVPAEGGAPQEVSHPVWLKAVVLTLVIVFIAIYVRVMYRQYFGRENSWVTNIPTRERWGSRLALLAIASFLVYLPSLTAFQSNAFAFSMIFVVIVWTLTSQSDKAFSAVITSTAITTAVLAGAIGPGEAFNVSIYSLGFGFFTSGYVINRGLINELYLERGRVADQAVAEERFRMARDLHDTVGHSMTQITLKAELARRVMATNPGRAASELEQIERLSRNLAREVRSAVAGDEHLGLTDEVTRSRQVLESMDIASSFSGDTTNMDPQVDSVLAWCLREGVMNVLKHSGASRCEIELRRIGSEHTLVIRDNGDREIVTNTGQGITGMTQRVEPMGGTVTLSRMDHGHTLTISVPAP